MLDYRLELTLWVCLSIALYVGWAYARRYVIEPGRGRIGRWLRRLLRHPTAGFAAELIAAGYYLGIPFAALVRGVAIPRFMGLSHLDWVRGAGSTLPLGILLFAALAFLERYASGEGSPPARSSRAADFVAAGVRALLLQAHWIFYRALAITWLGCYWGTLWGLLIPLAEWALTPDARELFRRPDLAGRALHTGGLAVASGLLFLFNRNAFLCLLAHWMMDWGLGKLGSRGNGGP